MLGWRYVAHFWYPVKTPNVIGSKGEVWWMAGNSMSSFFQIYQIYRQIAKKP